MSKFNTVAIDNSKTNNYEGGVSYKITDAKKAFINVIITSIFNADKFYESQESRFNTIFKLVKELATDDKLFLYKSLVYLRKNAYLRSAAHIVSVALAMNIKEDPNLRKAIRTALVRPDDLTEIFSLWKSINPDKNLPIGVRRAFADLLVKFDDYQLKKYSMQNKTTKLKDIVKLCHPKKDMKKLIEDKLPNINTVQTKFASGENKAVAMSDMINSNELGYMALLKNIKNFLEDNPSDEQFNNMIKLLSDANRARNAKILPFRFFDAFSSLFATSTSEFRIKEVKDVLNKVFFELADTVTVSDENEKVAILLDESGSMSSIFNIAKVMAALLAKNQNNITYSFATECRTLDNELESLSNLYKFDARGGGTNVYAPLDNLISTNTYVDKIVIFTDMQLYETSGWAEVDSEKFEDKLKIYRTINPYVKVLWWDLAGYNVGTPCKLNSDILTVSGYSDKMLEIVGKIFKNENALIDEIMSIELK